jgi:deoxyribose-phosphate aldolase
MRLNAYIDHTILKPDTLVSDIDRLCAEAIANKFAAVCVPPPFVRQAAGLLKNSAVKTATVIGFPFGYTPVEAKLAETLLAIVDGAEELDMVINLAALKNDDWNYLANEINHILPIVHQKGKKLKIIIESGLLTENEIIRCCELYGAAGADYLKTSTGFAAVNATVEAVRLMRKHLPSHVKIKASGGIRSNQFGVMLIEAGASRLGCSSSLQVINLDS